MPEKLTAQVVLSGTNLCYDRHYSYLVPEELDIRQGMRVLVPFGKGNIKKIALVTDIIKTSDNTDKLKPIIDVIDKQPVLDDELLNLMNWLRNNTLCTYFDAFRTMVPNGLSYKVQTHYQLANSQIDENDFSPEELDILLNLKNAKNQKEADGIFQVPDDASPSYKRHIDSLKASLIDKGAVEESDVFKRGVGDKTEQIVKLSEEYLSGDISIKLTAKQNAVVKLLEEVTSASVDEICYMTACTSAVIKRMTEKHITEIYSAEIMRKATSDAIERRSPDEIKLSDVQKKAFDGISSLIKENKPSGALLYGVTGSGKTSVFFKLINLVLSLGKTVIMMVPEISLTPQMVRKFKLYFGDDIALLHSSLSVGQRTDEYKRIKNGEAKIVIGTRSSVFAPLKNIGLIIMDEEGERTYKSDSSPRYHARDVAIQRCGMNNSVLLLASATPSVESFYFAKKGRFHLFEMRERFADAVLPEVEIVDMQSETKCSESGLFSRKLADAINEALERKEQVILLLNRRGFTTYASCSDCRQPVSCPNCNIPMTYHKKNNMLMCHYCGYKMNMPRECPQCGSNEIKQSGFGTQKVEDDLEKLFPSARLLRMDADTTFSRYAYEEKFSAFENGEYDIMLGTQMIAKGLNFPNVTLVGIISIDKALFTGDFRSYERTFSLITQVVGRSGRGDKPGKAYIQTFVPDHYVINLAADQNYDEFYEQESALRKVLIYPPYCDICTFTFSSVMESRVIEGSQYFMDLLKKYIKDNEIKIPLRALGPAPCTLERINNRYRYRIILKCRLSKTFFDMISYLLTEFQKDKRFSEVRCSADINGDIGL